MVYPRPSKEPHSTAGAVQATGQLSLRDIMAAVDGTKTLTPYGVARGGWQAIRLRILVMALLFMAVLFATTFALMSSYAQLHTVPPQAVVYLSLAGACVVGLFWAGQRRLTPIGWFIVDASTVAVVVLGILVLPQLIPGVADAITNTVIGWIVGPDMVVGTINPLHLN